MTSPPPASSRGLEDEQKEVVKSVYGPYEPLRRAALNAHFGKFVAYYRVSTDKQGQSGLGLDAQRQAVMTYLNGGPWKLIAEFTEVETGKRADRPELRLNYLVRI
jgi:Resolvase, N terminal domain